MTTTIHTLYNINSKVYVLDELYKNEIAYVSAIFINVHIGNDLSDYEYLLNIYYDVTFFNTKKTIVVTESKMTKYVQ